MDEKLQPLQCHHRTFKKGDMMMERKKLCVHLDSWWHWKSRQRQSWDEEIPDFVVESCCSGKLAGKGLSPRMLCICLSFYKDLPAQACDERGSWSCILIKPQQMILLLPPILFKTSAASFNFVFCVHKNVKNILALNNTIFPFLTDGCLCVILQALSSQTCS